MNSLLNGLIGSLGRTSTPSVLLQALGAAMRGENPSDFMKNLANTYPQLRPYNLDNLQSTAQQICQQKGVNTDAVINQLNTVFDPYVK